MVVPELIILGKRLPKVAIIFFIVYMQIFHCVYRVAEALIALQKAGNVSYLNWKMEVKCEQRIIEALSNQAIRMENDLQNWTVAVKQYRSLYYDLNYFTTPQLLYLRRQLGSLKADTTSASINHEVLGLLKSVSTNITGDEVIHAVKVAASTRQRLQIENIPSCEKGLTITCNHRESKEYLSIEQLAVVLKSLSGEA